MNYESEIKEVLAALKDDADINYFIQTYYQNGFNIKIIAGLEILGKTFKEVNLISLEDVVTLITSYVFFESSTYTERELKIERSINGVKYFYFIVTVMYELFTVPIEKNQFNDKNFKLKFDPNYHDGNIKLRITKCFPGIIKYYMNLVANGVSFELSLEDQAACLTHALYDDTIRFKLCNPLNYANANADISIKPEQLTKSFIVKNITDTILTIF